MRSYYIIIQFIFAFIFEISGQCFPWFISLEISCSLLIIFSLFSFIFAWTFISLQIKEFRIMGLSINDSVYSLIILFTGLMVQQVPLDIAS